jgi:peroxidase
MSFISKNIELSFTSKYFGLGLRILQIIPITVNSFAILNIVFVCDYFFFVSRDFLPICLWDLNSHACYIVQLGGPTWAVQLGRRDSTTASKTTANNDIPAPFMDLPDLIINFKKHGLNKKDLVVLSGAHTIGFAQCFTFKDRIYNETNIDPKFARERKLTCPRTGGDSNLAPLNPTPSYFDARYYNDLLKKRGLFHSDQALFNGGSTDSLVKAYSSNVKAFWTDFANSMVKMGNINPLTGKQGQTRLNCRKVN